MTERVGMDGAGTDGVYTGMTKLEGLILMLLSAMRFLNQECYG